MNEEVKSFLNKIEELNQQNIEVFCISQNKNINCSPLTFKQQKELISTVADGTMGVLKFQKILNDIIIKNSGDNTLLIIDKLPIILSLRNKCLGNIVKIDGEEFDIDDNIKKSKKIKTPKIESIKDQIEVELQIATLTEENRIIQQAIEVLKNEKDVGKNLGNIYTYEIVKYIKSVKFGENELNFSDLSIADRVKIVDNLPLSVNKKIVTFIESIRKQENEVLKIGDKSFDIDVAFFDN